MEEVAEAAASVIGKALVDSLVKASVPIIAKKVRARFLGTRHEVRALFAIVLGYYERPSVDDASRIIDSCLKHYRERDKYLVFDDVSFLYQVNHEVIDDFYVTPGMEELEYGEVADSVSLSDIRFSPHVEGELPTRSDGKKIIMTAFKLMNDIIIRLENSQEATDFLRIRSKTRLMAVHSDFPYVNELRTKLKEQARKDEITPSPYLTVIERIDGKGELILSLEDTSVLRRLLQNLGLV